MVYGPFQHAGAFWKAPEILLGNITKPFLPLYKVCLPPYGHTAACVYAALHLNYAERGHRLQSDVALTPLHTVDMPGGLPNIRSIGNCTSHPNMRENGVAFVVSWTLVQ